MSIEDRPDWFLLSAYFSGGCTDDERATVERWLAARPEHRELARQFRILWEARQRPPHRDYDHETAVAYVMAAIRQPPASSRRPVSRQRTLPQVVRALFAEMASRAMAALFGPHDATLSAAEVERIRTLIDRAEADDT